MYVGFRLLRTDLDGLVDLRRRQLSEELSERFHATVQFGPFRGMRFPDGAWWGMADRACMLLGLYEQEVQDTLVKASQGRSTFVDLGAADGFYAIGALVSGLFSRSIAFEMSEEGRRVIAEAARLNQVESRIAIRGVADDLFLGEIADFDPSDAVILVDIEGGEFDLFDERVFSRLEGAIIIIELHPDYPKDGDAKVRRLLRQAKPYFGHKVFSMGSRNPNVPVLHDYPDNSRWLMCAEGRPSQMSWIALQPRDATDAGDAT